MFIQPKFRLRSKPSLLRYLFISLFISSTLFLKGSDTITNISNIATCLGDGLYGTKVSFLSDKNENWEVFEVFNLSDSLSTSTNQIAILPNSSLKEATQSLNKSVYSIYGKYKSGNKYFIRFINKFGKYHTVYAGGESYQNFNIAGKNAVCLNSKEFYEVPPFSNGYKVVLNGGTILSSNIDSSRVEVRWSNLPGNYNISFERKGQLNCFSKSIMQVAVGSSSTSMACKANLQISLDINCVLNVTPQLLSSVNIAPNEPYAVVLLQGSYMLPNNQLNYSHVGKIITAKLIQGCSGNSCWTSLRVEDKAAPQIICKDTIVVNCFDKHYPKPIAIDNCDHIVQTTLVDSNLISNPCNNVYSAFINMSYTAKDKLGNKSKTCNQVLAIKRIPFDSISFPENYTHSNALSCKGYKKDKDGMPSPEVTGYPNYNCMNIDLNHSQTCNVYSTYEDTRFGYNGCIEKIMRKWTLVEWYCNTSKIRKHTQVIYIKDDVSPSIKCPSHKTVSAEGSDCIATFKFDPLVEVKDECSTLFDYTVSYGNGGIGNLNTSISLSPGLYPLIYIVTDQCGNSTTCTSSLNVLDLSAPVVVCHQTTVVGLNSFGDAHIYPSSINDGSYDVCGLDSFKIRRMDDTLGFREKIHFSCLDVAKEIMVEMKVWNRTGLANSCMTIVVVQDKTKPTINCPKDVTISCEENYDLNNLKKYGEATGNDACDFTIKEKAIEFVNQCRVGFIERTFTIYDRQDSTFCKSKIVLEKESATFNVKWPKDYSVKDSCSIASLHPDKLPKGFDVPVVETNGGCQLIASNFVDDYFTINDNGSCFKIIRTWTVIDYCLMNEPNYAPSIHQQLIKISNTIDPVVVLEADSSTCTLDTDCENGKVKLKASANDDCTMKDKLRWRYQIDFDFNGTFNADSTRYYIGEQVDASGEYKVGKHRIIFTVEDGCGNVVSKFHDFVIKNCKAPSPVCISNLSVTLNQMYIDGKEIRMACVDAKSLDASSSHFCNFPIGFSFSKNISDTTKCFTCNDLGINRIPLFVTDNFGNAASCIVEVDVQKNDDSEIAINASKNLICNGETITLSVHGSNMVITDYLWSTGETTPTINVSPASTQTYSVSVNNNDACVLSKSITINVLPKINLQINGNTTNVLNACEGEPVTLIASGGSSYRWSNNLTTSSITVTPTINTMYTVTATDANGCTTTLSKTVSLNPKPIASISSATQSICPNESIGMTASGGTSYLWSNGATAATITVTPLVNTTYTVSVTTNGCTATTSRAISIKETPTIVLSGNLSICAGTSTTVTAANSQNAIGNIYQWSNGVTSSSNTVSPSILGGTETYTVTVTNAIGCTNSQIANVNVNPLPVITISPENPGVCPGAGATLTASGGETYSWNTIPPQNTPSITVNPVIPTVYTVTVTSSQGCIASATKQVVISTTPVASISSALNSVCQGSSLVLTASGGSSYEWNTNPVQTTSSITVTPTANTNYIVTVTNSNNCTDTASRFIMVLPTNFGNVMPLTTTRICIGTSTTLTASGGGTYLWSNNATTAAITVSPTFTTTYTVTITNNGCTSTVSRIVEVEPLPVALITGNLSICAGGFTTLTATNLVNPNGNIYSWSNGANTPSITVLPATTSTYTVTILNSGCGGMNNVVSATVTVNPPLTATITGPTQVCAGQVITLTAAGGTSFAWNTVPPQTTSSITVNPAATTTYAVTVSTGPGCSASTNRTVTVLPSPIATISGDLNICPSESTILTANNTSTSTTGTNTYNWNTTPAQTSQTITVSPSSTTTYTVTITNANGCTDTENATVVVNPKITTSQLSCQNLTEVITNLGTVTVNSKKYVSLPTASCNNEEFKFSYSKTNINDTLKIYNCDSLGIRNVKIYFFQNGVFSNDSCNTTVTITDPPSPGNPNGFCTNNIFKLSGQIETENKVSMEDVEVNLINIDMHKTNENGAYEFPKMQAASTYKVQPYKNDGILDGLSTLDLIMIERHILGSAKLSSPYKLIAADINNDNKITAADLVELRKVLLGTKDNFVNNTSWKFVCEDFKFPDIKNPFMSQYPLYKEIYEPTINSEADFIAVKIGDVNTSYAKNVISPIHNLNLIMREVNNEISTDKEIKVSLENISTLDGMQLEFSISELKDLKVVSNIFSDEEISYFVDGPILRIVIATKEAKEVSGKTIFSIKGITPNERDLSDFIMLIKNKWEDEVYHNGEVYKPNFLLSQLQTVHNEFISLAYPNPWSSYTNLSFELTQDQAVQIIVKDLSGRILHSKAISGKIGNNYYEIKSSDVLNVKGILMYEIITSNQKSIGKMFHIE